MNYYVLRGVNGLNRPGPTKSDSEFLRLKVMLDASNSGSGAIPGKCCLQGLSK